MEPARCTALAAAALALACAARQPWGRASEVSQTGDARRVAVEVTRGGFVPNRIAARSGETLTLVFTRSVERACADRVVLYLDEDRRIERDLPLGIPVSVTLSLERAGELGFSCHMRMYGGAIDVR